MAPAVWPTGSDREMSWPTSNKQSVRIARTVFGRLRSAKILDHHQVASGGPIMGEQECLPVGRNGEADAYARGDGIESPAFNGTHATAAAGGEIVEPDLGFRQAVRVGVDVVDAIVEYGK